MRTERNPTHKCTVLLFLFFVGFIAFHTAHHYRTGLRDRGNDCSPYGPYALALVLRAQATVPLDFTSFCIVPQYPSTPVYSFSCLVEKTRCRRHYPASRIHANATANRSRGDRDRLQNCAVVGTQNSSDCAMMRKYEVHAKNALAITSTTTLSAILPLPPHSIFCGSSHCSDGYKVCPSPPSNVRFTVFLGLEQALQPVLLVPKQQHIAFAWPRQEGKLFLGMGALESDRKCVAHGDI